MSIIPMRATLSEKDIRRLIKGKTAEDRAQAAHKVCRRISNITLTETEKSYAEEILAMLSRDSAELVRRTMAITLRMSPNLPRKLALQLSQDVESVAIPVIENSPVFTDSDLIELILSASDSKQTAVARRENLYESVTEMITEHGCKEAVIGVTSNASAQFSDKSYDNILNRFRTDQDINTVLVMRDRIPSHIAEKMISLVSGKLFDYLVNNHELPPQLAIELASGARERATLDLIEQAAHTSDMAYFVQQLQLNGRLTHSMIMRALCMGYISFVEWALAELSNIPHPKAWLMIHDAGSLGLRAIFEKAGLPQRMFSAFRAAIDVLHETEYTDAPNARKHFRSSMIERALTQFQAIPKADLDYLLDKLDARDDYLSQIKNDVQSRNNSYTISA